MLSKFLKRYFFAVKWHNLRKLKPISNVFAFDRGTPIDRYYIERFLQQNSNSITGIVCEIAENTYSKKFGANISKYHILHYDKNAPKATIIGDLTDYAKLPENAIDCFVCTQTLNFIYDFKSAIRGIHHMLKPGGIALITVAGISQISRYDMDRWGDYWRFTDLSFKMALEEVFAGVKISNYGNILTTTAFLQGIAAEELTTEELDFIDPDYQLTITAVCQK